MSILSRNNAASLKANREQNDPLSLRDLEERFIVDKREPKPEAKKPEAKKPISLLGGTACAYLAVALDKASSERHPNFVRAIKRTPKGEERLKMFTHIRMVAARAYDQYVKQLKATGNLSAIKPAIVGALKALKAEAPAYVQLLKDLAADVAFQAHMDVRALLANISTDQMDAGIDAMGESHDPDPSDPPLFDQSEAQRSPKREPYEGGEPKPEPIALRVEDAEEAVKEVQAWLGLAITGFEPGQADWHGVAGVFPLGSKKVVGEDGEPFYTNITEFSEYIAYQDAQWKLKRNTVKGAEESLDLMEAA